MYERITVNAIIEAPGLQLFYPGFGGGFYYRGAFNIEGALNKKVIFRISTLEFLENQSRVRHVKCFNLQQMHLVSQSKFNHCQKGSHQKSSHRSQCP